MTRRDQEAWSQFGHGRAQQFERFEQPHLFGRVRAGGDDKRALLVESEARLQCVGQFLRAGFNGRIEFQIAGDAYAFGRETERAYALSVRVSLHDGERERVDDSAYEAAQFFVTAK